MQAATGGWCSQVAVQHYRELQWLLLLLVFLLLLLLLRCTRWGVATLGCRHDTVKLQCWSTTTRRSGGLLGGTVVSQTIAYVTLAFPSQVPITRPAADSQFDSHHSVDPPCNVMLRVAAILIPRFVVVQCLLLADPNATTQR